MSVTVSTRSTSPPFRNPVRARCAITVITEAWLGCSSWEPAIGRQRDIQRTSVSHHSSVQPKSNAPSNLPFSVPVGPPTALIHSRTADRLSLTHTSVHRHRLRSVPGRRWRLLCSPRTVTLIGVGIARRNLITPTSTLALRLFIRCTDC